MSSCIFGLRLSSWVLCSKAAANAVSDLSKRTEDLGARDGFWGFFQARNDTSHEWTTPQSALSQEDVKRTVTLDLSLGSERVASFSVAAVTTDRAIPTFLGIKAVGITKDMDRKRRSDMDCVGHDWGRDDADRE
ncbi:unnamed protein product [Clonostachys rosea]|uniref:Secreted protein n=1 Tax=Bionectria ochroleuca TaxID=29856 RepID=A0ABY6UPN3_BIOOC|nr:unnamed protein product [Clonostachys rosea]